MAYSEGGLEEDLRAQADSGAGAADQMSRSESDNRSDGGDSAKRDGHAADTEQTRDQASEAGQDGETGSRDSRDDGDRASRRDESLSHGADTGTSQGGSTTDRSTDSSSTTGGSADAGGRRRS